MKRIGFRWVAAAVVVVLGCSVIIYSQGWLRRQFEALYAYATADEFVVMRGDTSITSEPVSFGSNYGRFDSDYGKIVWTHDHRYAVVLVGAPEGPKDDNRRILVAIDVTSGKVQRVPCAGCLSMAAVGGGKVLVTKRFPGSEGADDNVRFLRVDFSAQAFPVLLPLVSRDIEDKFKQPNGETLEGYEGLTQFPDAEIMDGTPGEVLVVPSFVGSPSFMRLQPDGRLSLAKQKYSFVEPMGPSEIRSLEGRRVVVSAAVAPGNNPNLVTALVSRFVEPCNGGECVRYCEAVDDVFVAQLGNGAVTRTDISPAYPPYVKPGLASGLKVKSVWWGADGHLHAIISTQLCTGGHPPYPLAGPTEWRLEGNRWVQVSDRQVLAVREVDGGKLRIDGKDKTAMSGTLVAYVEGGVKKIASEVIALGVPVDNKCTFDVDGWCGGAKSRPFRIVSNPNGNSERPEIFFEIGKDRSQQVLGSRDGDADICEEQRFAKQLDEAFPDRISVRIACRHGLAYVKVAGKGPQVYAGSGDLLFIRNANEWLMLTGGSNSFGILSSSDLQGVGFTPEVFKRIFPEVRLAF